MNMAVAPRQFMGFTGAVLAGGASAMLFAMPMRAETGAAFFGSLLLGYMAPILLFMAGLGAGGLGGLTAAVAGFLVLLVSQPSNFAFIYVFLFAAPAVILCMLALRFRVGDDQKIYWYPEGYLLTAAIFYPCVIFLVVYAALASQPGGLLGLTQQFYASGADDMIAKLNFDADKAALARASLEGFARVTPALLGQSWMMLILIGAILGQKILEQQKWNLRSGFSLTGVHVPNWLIYASAVTGLAGGFAPAPYDFIGTNLCVLLCLPFFFVGLAVVHAWAATTGAPSFVLIVFYLVLVLPWFTAWLAVMLVMLGVADQWINFRQRFAARINKAV